MEMIGSGDGLQRWRATRSHRSAFDGWTISLRSFADVLLAIAAAGALWRGTQMWVGYPSSQSELDTISPLTMQLVLYALFPLVALYIVIDWNALVARIRSTSVLLIVTLLFIALSVVASLDPTASARGLFGVVTISAPILLFSLRFGAVGSARLLRNFAIVAVFANIAYAVIVPQYGFMTGSLAGTMRGLFAHKNLFGQAMAVYLVVLIPSPAERPFGRYPVVIRTVACIGALGCIIASHSSTALVQTALGLISLVFAAGVISIASRTFRSYAIILTLLVTLGLLFFGGMLIASSVAQEVGKDLTLSGRTGVWSALLPHILDYPFTGYGFGMLRNTDLISQLTTSVTWGVRSTHNSYIELLLNIGIPGAFAWFAFLVSRLYGKLVTAPDSQIGRMARNRQIAVMLMILFGAFTEAGQMFATLAMWPILLLMLPNDDRPAPAQATR